MLDQLLGAGQSVAQKAGQSGYANFGTGILAGGALGLLLGDKRVRKFGGKALIAAAKSDGHIDPRERGLIEEQLGRMAGDASLRSWIDAEVARPLDPAEVASAANGSMEIATEMYLVSVLAVDSESFMERAYLDALATQLKLPADLRTQLESEARQAASAASGA